MTVFLMRARCPTAGWCSTAGFRDAIVRGERIFNAFQFDLQRGGTAHKRLLPGRELAAQLRLVSLDQVPKSAGIAAAAIARRQQRSAVADARTEQRRTRCFGGWRLLGIEVRRTTYWRFMQLCKCSRETILHELADGWRKSREW